MLKKILKIGVVSLLLSACSGFEKNQTTTCQDGEVLIIKKGQFFPYTYTLTGIWGWNGDRVHGSYDIYIPKDKLEDYVVNHNYRKDGTKRYNNTDKVIRVLKWHDEGDRRYKIKARTYDRKGTCVKRDDLIYISSAPNIHKIKRW